VKITFVAPATDISRRTGRRPKGTPFFHYYKLGIATLAGATPSDFEVEAVDEMVDLWDPARHPTDVVAISVLTALAPRAYQIADTFRKRNIPVVLGGMHPTFLPNEAADHADAVIMGAGELVWPAVCRDLLINSLQHVYRADPTSAQINVPAARRDLFTNRFYPPLDLIQFSRGCIHHCNFCSVNAFFSRHYYWRPIEEVQAELPLLRRKHLMVADDNIYGNRDYCLRALATLAPLRKYIGIQGTVDMAFDDEVMNAAREAKVSAVFVGLESIVPGALEESNKRHNQIDRYAEAIAAFHKRGIFVEGGLMFGFEHDDPTVFKRTMQAMQKIKLDVAQIAVVTPMPGTDLFTRLEREGRIIDRDWRNYDCNHVVFQPKQMTVLQLMNGLELCRREFYSRRAILRRSVHALFSFNFVTWATQTAFNWGFRHNHQLGLDYPP